MEKLLDRLDELAFAVENGAFVHGFGSDYKVAREIKEIVKILRALIK